MANVCKNLIRKKPSLVSEAIPFKDTSSKKCILLTTWFL